MNAYTRIEHTSESQFIEDGNTSTHTESPRFRTLLQYLNSVIGKWWQHYLLIERVHDERRQLVSLSDRELLDMGITRAQALQESLKPRADLPENRRTLER